MSRTSEEDLVAFRDALREELRKEASLQSSLGGAGALGGVGAAVGALGGAALHGIRNYRQAREEGADRGGAVLSGVGGALHGASRGALLGGGLGAGAGALAGHISPGAMEGVRKGLTGAGGGVGSIARFGQRQVHALTGWTPTPGDARSVRQIGAGAAGAEEKLRSAVDSANTLHKGLSGKNPAALQRAVGHVESARKGYGAAYRAEQMGLTSLPGYAKSVKDRGLLPTMSAGFKEQWHSMSPGWKALMVGAPLAETAAALHGPEQEGGPGKAERVARGLTGAVMGATMGSIPVATSSLLLGPAASHGAGMVGRGIDRLRGRKSFKHDTTYLPAETSGSVTPLERHLSESMAGQQQAPE